MPSHANRLAILRPMPREAPVTIAVLAKVFSSYLAAASNKVLTFSSRSCAIFKAVGLPMEQPRSGATGQTGNCAARPQIPASSVTSPASVSQRTSLCLSAKRTCLEEMVTDLRGAFVHGAGLDPLDCVGDARVQLLLTWSRNAGK